MRKNILLSQYEPTDKELSDLMKEVLEDVRNKTLKTKKLVRQNILLEIERVKKSFKA